MLLPKFAQKLAHGRPVCAAELDTLVAGADIVVVLLPLTPRHARRPWDRKFLARMRRGALLVNAGRHASHLGLDLVCSSGAMVRIGLHLRVPAVVLHCCAQGPATASAQKIKQGSAPGGQCIRGVLLPRVPQLLFFSSASLQNSADTRAVVAGAASASNSILFCLFL